MRRTIILALIALFGLSVTCSGGEVDPYVKMDNCSGTVFHASDKYGVWILTAGHCADPGNEYNFYFFRDGVRSNAARGVCLREHSRYDVAVCWVNGRYFDKKTLPRAIPLASPKRTMLFRGQVVYLVGCFAGGTVSPAQRKLSIMDFDPRGYSLTVNDGSWGGHSGGGVVDLLTGRLIGVVWATNSRFAGTETYITGPQAIRECVYVNGRDASPQFSVADTLKPLVRVRCSQNANLSKMQADIEKNHTLKTHVDFEYRLDPKQDKPYITWSGGGQKWYYVGWEGNDGFLWQLQRTGVTLGCRDG